MRNQYYNASHCPDPTAYEALVNVTREDRKINRLPKKTKGQRRKKGVF